jgi:hypothetical protein
VSREKLKVGGSQRVKTQPTANGEGLPLMGARYWIDRAAVPHADRVGPNFVLAPFPRRGASEPLVTPVPADEPRKSRARRGTGRQPGGEAA